MRLLIKIIAGVLIGALISQKQIKKIYDEYKNNRG